MVFTEVESFFANIDPNKRLLGIDLGEKKAGIAVSDFRQVIATPYLVYKRRNMKKDLGFVNGVFQEKGCTGVVLGLPDGVNEEDNAWVEKIISFAEKLSKWYNINIYLQDESLTTKEACIALKYLSYAKSAQKDDKVAASCILQRVLDIMQLNN